MSAAAVPTTNDSLTSPFTASEQCVVNSPLSVQGFYHFAWSDRADPAKRIEVAYTDKPSADNVLVEITVSPGDSDPVNRRITLSNKEGERLLLQLANKRVPADLAKVSQVFVDQLELRPDLTEFYYRADDETKATVRMRAQPVPGGFQISKTHTSLDSTGQVATSRSRETTVPAEIGTMLMYFHKTLIEPHRRSRSESNPAQKEAAIGERTWP